MQVDGSILRPGNLTGHVQVRAPYFHGLLTEAFHPGRASRKPVRVMFEAIGWTQLSTARADVELRARELGCRVPVLALAFVVQHRACESVVVGASTVEQARENATFFAEAWELVAAGSQQ